MNLWIPSIEDESLICQKEKGNEYELLLEITLLGHMPQNICDHFWKFNFHSVLGKRVNGSAGYGLEILVCFFIFQGHVKGTAWVKKKIKDAEKRVQSRIEKCILEQYYMTWAIQQVYHKRYVYALYLM